MLRQDPQRAKVEILKHLDGDLVITQRPSVAGERRAEISGRAKSDSLLRDQEAVCLQVVAASFVVVREGKASGRYAWRSSSASS